MSQKQITRPTSWKKHLADWDRQHNHHVLVERSMWGPYSPIGEALMDKCGAEDAEQCQDAIVHYQKWAKPLEKLQVAFTAALRAGPMGQPLDILWEIDQFIELNQAQLEGVVDKQKYFFVRRRREEGPSAGYSWD